MKGHNTFGRVRQDTKWGGLIIARGGKNSKLAKVKVKVKVKVGAELNRFRFPLETHLLCAAQPERVR